jgi:hypothetical protein
VVQEVVRNKARIRAPLSGAKTDAKGGSMIKRRDFLKQIAISCGGMAGAAVQGFGQPVSSDGLLAGDTPEVFKTIPIQLGSEKQVFVDWWFTEPGYGLHSRPEDKKQYDSRPYFSPYGVRLSVIAPTLSAEPIIVPDIPSDGDIIAAECLLRDGGKFRLWYSTLSQPAEESRYCYAESEDGKRWVKPNLGLIEFKGSKQNNIVDTIGGSILKDTIAPPEERYKVIYELSAPHGQLPAYWTYVAVSPDGFRWKRIPEPILKYTSDNDNVLVYDEERKKYVAYVRGWEPQLEIGFGSRRVVRRTESVDFRSFPYPETVLSAGPDDPPDLNFYTSAYQRWPGAPCAHIMLPAFYHRNADIVDVHLAVSRDGVRWFRPSKEPLIPVGPDGSGYEGMVFASIGIVPLTTGVWGFIIGGSRFTHNSYHYEHFKKPRGAIWLATIREDGLMALEADSEGECWTNVVTFKGTQMRVNSWAREGGRLPVELATAEGKPIPGFALADCDGAEGDALWLPVRWRGSSDLSSVVGRQIRIRFHLIRCRLHAFRFG